MVIPGTFEFAMGINGLETGLAYSDAVITIPVERDRYRRCADLLIVEYDQNSFRFGIDCQPTFDTAGRYQTGHKNKSRKNGNIALTHKNILKSL